MISTKLFRPTLAAFLVSAFSASLQASMVRDDVDYQYFRDFGENKGQFGIGATNIPIYDKQGKQVGTMLPNLPMPDLSAATRTTGMAVLFNPQYMTSVAHNRGYSAVQFGEAGSNPDSHHFDYQITDRNDHSRLDFHAPRLHKLVTEVAPLALNKPEMVGNVAKENTFLDTERYPYFVRVGSGLQQLRHANNENTQVHTGYVYLTGGTALRPVFSKDHTLQFEGNLFEDGLSTYALPGDSGSALLAYDAKEKRWVLVANLATFFGVKNTRNNYTILPQDFIAKSLQDDELNVNINSPLMTWSKRSENTGVLQNGSQEVEIGLYDESLKVLEDGKQRLSLANGKTVHFNGQDNSTLQFTESINQGAGALHFNQNMTVKGSQADTTWEGAGVVVNKGKTVSWQVKNPEGDRLSKLGEGMLYVNGQGKNLGDISVGEGTVVLDQKALNGEQQAFNQVGITSGRGTVVLANDKQVNPDRIYFGFRGGRLDLNGNALHFNYIQNTDEGARIVNHHLKQTASITVSGKPARTAEEIEWLNWRQHPKTALGLYKYVNRHQGGRTDYFVLKEGGNPGQYFPTNQISNEHWEFLSSDEQTAIQTVLDRENQRQRIETFSGYFGETDSARPNGALNVTYRPHNADRIWLLNGGMNLKGQFNVEQGNVVLSGVPVPHAYDHLNKQEVVREDEWIDRQFSANNFNVSGNATLTSGRNVAQIEGNLTAHQQAKINLGFVQGESSECIRSGFTGATQCSENRVLADRTFAEIPSTAIQGNVHLFDQSQFTLGKAHLTGAVSADRHTQMTLKPASQWTMTANSTLGNVALSPTSQITLNSQYEQPQAVKGFNQLTINGDLTGTGTFRYLTDMAARLGDHVLVNGLAKGSFLLSVKNTGREPTEVSPLSLMKLNNAQQKTEDLNVALDGGFVDLGAYRYILANRNNDYRLYNPLKEAQNQAAVTTEMIEASKRSYQQANLQMAEKEQELARLNEELRQANQQKNTDQALVNRLSREIQQTNQRLTAIQNEYYRPYRMRAQKRQQLYQQYAQLQRNLTQQRTQLRQANSKVSQNNQQVQQINLLLNQAKNSLAQANATQQQLAQEVTSLENRYEAMFEQARQLCQAQGLSQNLCLQVAKLANESELSVIDEQVDAGIEQLESAQQALTLAEQQGNAETIAKAQLAVEQAAENLLARLENAYQTFGEIEQFLNTQSSNVAMPTQSALISRYANTALSEMAANVNVALQLGRNLDRQLLNENRANVWANTESTKQSYHSDFYRPYKQTLTLTQIGVAHQINDTLEVGAVLSHSRANNTFDENVSGKNRLTALSAYVKNSWENGIFASLDLGYGRSRNSIKLDEQESVFHRNLFSAGLNTGIRWDWGITVQPSVGVRYYRLSGADYELSEAKIANRALNLTAYRAGVELNKAFSFDHFSLKPSWASYYYDATQRKMSVDGALAVNNVEMKQQFGRYWQHEAGLTAQFNQWQIGANLGFLKGSDVRTQKYAAFKLGYRW